MEIKKTTVCILLILPVFFVANTFAQKAKGAKELFKLIDEKGIDIDPNKRRMIEEKVKEEEKVTKEAEAYWKWSLKQRFKLIGKWKKVLAEKIKEADRIEIQTTPPYEPNKHNEVLHMINGNDKVLSFLKILEISEWGSGGHCACYGDALLVFYDGDKKLATLSYHHLQSLRWYGGPWPGDAAIKEKSQSKLPLWFESEGYSGFENINRQKLKERNAKEQFMKYFPKEVQEDVLGNSIENPIKDKLRELNLKYNDKEVSKIYASSLAMGLAADVTSETGFVSFYLGHFKGIAFSNALNELKDNEQGMLGAAQMYFYYISLLDIDHEINIVKGNCKLTAEEKKKFGIKLAPYILNNGNIDWQKRMVIQWLSEANEPEAVSMLFDTARGKMGKEVSYNDKYEQEPGIRASAYLYLVQHKELAAADEIKVAINRCNQEQDIAALKLALCLLGESDTFDEKYFIYSSYSIGNAALQVIERNPTRKNVDILINTGIDHPYGLIREDAKYLFQKITKVDWLPTKGEDGKNKKQMSYTMELEKIREWWKENRDKF